LKAKTIAAQPLDPPPNKNLASSIKGRVIDDAARPEQRVMRSLLLKIYNPCISITKPNIKPHTLRIDNTTGARP
jgi:hypothetical protein